MKVHHYALVLAGLGLVVVAGATQQGGTAPAGAAQAKIAVMSVRDAIVGTAEGRQSSAELQSQFAPRYTEVDKIRKDIEDLQKRLETGQRTLSAEQQASMQRQGELLTKQLQRKQDELNDEVQAAQADVFDRIGRKMLDVLDRYARENNISLVLDKSAQNSPVINSSTQIDITQEIIRLYDAQYPVKGAAPAAKQPGTPAAPPKKPGTN